MEKLKLVVRKAKNLTSVPSQPVIRTAAQELRNDKKLDSDEIAAIHKQYLALSQRDTKSKHLKGCLRRLSYSPFMAVLASERQIQCYALKAKHKNLVICIDATGGFIKNLQRKYSNRILYYNIVCRGQNSYLSIASAISEKHTSREIGIFSKK